MAPDPQHLRALVDMGSNGIRFSITDLTPPSTRLLPTIYLSRSSISLYDAQYPPGSTSRQPLPAATISAVLSALSRFRLVTRSFRIPDDQVTLLATEATRTAPNATDFVAQISARTGWAVTLLSKADEARVGAWGVLSSVHLPGTHGVALDVGGGSAQLSLLSVSAAGQLMPAEGQSLPFGAAALSRRLAEAQAQGSVARLEAEVQAGVRAAWDALPRSGEGRPEMLFVSGGGMRGWGFVLLAAHAVQPYPVAVINGFTAGREAFLGTQAVEAAAAASTADEDDAIHRVSARRAAQVPAVALLVRALAAVVPVRETRFCQGGVREGWLFASLPRETQVLHPLVVAAGGMARARAEGAEGIAALLGAALPAPGVFDRNVLIALAAALNAFAGVPKDIQAAAALRCTTTGALAGAHGLAHEDRARLGVMLCERHGGREALAVAERGFYDALAGLLGREEAWWAKYIGRVAGVLGEVYPAGWEEKRVEVESWIGEGKKGPRLEVRFREEGEWRAVLEEEVEKVEKVGKRKNWSGGREGWGLKVEVRVERW